MKGAIILKSLNSIEQDNLIKLGNEIKKARLDKDLSLRELSSLCGINHKTLFFIESGKTKTINPNTLVRLSSVLKIDLVKLLILAGYFELVFRLRYENKKERKDDKYV